MRFRSHQHLRTSRDFQEVRTRGRRIQCGVFLFQASVREELSGVQDGPRLGVITSRRVGKAVVRNRLRRLMREVFRANQDRLRRDCDIVLVMRASAAGQSLEELEWRFLRAVEESEMEMKPGMGPPDE